MGIETSPRITQKEDKDNLGPTSKHPFAFKKGINVVGREKTTLFPKRVVCFCLIPLPKNLPATTTYPTTCTTFEYWRRKVTKGKTEVAEAMEGGV